MRTFRFPWRLAAAFVVLGVGAVASIPTRSQINANPSWVPIGVSASGNSSTAWFHEPSARQAVACRTVEAPGGTLSGVQCVAGKLP